MPRLPCTRTRTYHAPLSIKEKKALSRDLKVLARDLRKDITGVACTPSEILTGVASASACALIGGGIAVGMQAFGVCDMMRRYSNSTINTLFIGAVTAVAAILAIIKPSHKTPRKCLDPDPCGLKAEKAKRLLEKSAKMSRSLLAEPSLSPLGVKPRIQ